MLWLRWVSLKLQVFFAEYNLFYRALLQKRPRRFNLRNCDRKHTHVSYMFGMGWLRWVGSLKLQVSFAEYNLFCRALLQTRLTILRSLLIVATPYVCVGHDSLQVAKMEGGTDDVVSFAKEPYKRDYILQKRPVILRSLLIVATPIPESLRHTATRWHALQHTVTHCNTNASCTTRATWLIAGGNGGGGHGRRRSRCNTLQHTATHCSTLEYECMWKKWRGTSPMWTSSTTHCNPLQHTATHCNTLLHKCRLKRQRGKRPT